MQIVYISVKSNDFSKLVFYFPALTAVTPMLLLHSPPPPPPPNKPAKPPPHLTPILTFWGTTKGPVLMALTPTLLIQSPPPPPETPASVASAALDADVDALTFVSLS